MRPWAKSLLPDLVPAAENESDAPQSGDAHQREDDSGEDRGLSAEDPGYQVKTEDTHQTPVDAANDDQGQRDPV